MQERQISYAEAIREATDQAMGLCDKVIVLGQLVDTPSGIFGTTTGLADKYGAERVQYFPVSENLMTAAALGAATIQTRRACARLERAGPKEVAQGVAPAGGDDAGGGGVRSTVRGVAEATVARRAAGQRRPCC